MFAGPELEGCALKAEKAEPEARNVPREVDTSGLLIGSSFMSCPRFVDPRFVAPDSRLNCFSSGLWLSPAADSPIASRLRR